MRRLLCVKTLGALLLSCLFFTSAAQAATFNATSTGPGVWEFGASYGSGQQSFSDSWNFYLDQDSALNVSIEQVVAPSFPGFFELTNLNGEIIQGESSLDSGLSFTTDLLTAGAYVLNISGDVSGTFGGGYAGTISAVPLPAAAWLFGSALVGLLTLARRRNQRALYA